MYQGKYYSLDDFSGGDARRPTGVNDNLPANQASALDNLLLLPGGRGFYSRQGVVKINETELGTASDGFPVTGLGWLSIGQGSQNRLVAVKKDKIYSSSNASSLRHSATFSDVTGAVTVTPESTGGADMISSRWAFCVHNDVLIAFGGQTDGPVAPWKYTGSGNASALGGSPPSARWGFSANNRVFAGSTSSAVSTLYWSVLGNAEDWTGTGSGSAVIGSLEDGEPITGAAVLGQNFALVFKPNSIYRLDLTSAPFSSQILFKGVGALLGSLCVVDGAVYFITPNGDMAMTDGNEVRRFPMNGNGQIGFSGIGSQSAIITPGPSGFRLRPPYGFDYDYDIIVWCDPQAPAVGWDLQNKCWLYFSTGMKFTCLAMDKAGRAFGGGNATRGGFIYSPESQSALWTDDSEDGGSVTASWTSGWMNPGPSDQFVRPERFIVSATGGTSLTLALTYGYDYGSLSRSATLDADSSSGSQYRAFLTGRGNVFRFALTLNTTTHAQRVYVTKITIGGKVVGQKADSA